MQRSKGEGTGNPVDPVQRRIISHAGNHQLFNRRETVEEGGEVDLADVQVVVHIDGQGR